MINVPRVSRFLNNSGEIVVIGGGVAGLTAAAVLAADGARVTVLERHNVPGGCASFYQRDGYRFDVGATLVGGFGRRGVHRRLFAALGVDLAATPVEPAMAVHLGDDPPVIRWGDARWAPERRRAFGDEAEPFWTALEAIAERAWGYAAHFPAGPVDLRALRPAHLPLVATLGRTVADLFPPRIDGRLRAFVDAQLLITAQADAATTDLAYGATALDLAREGTFHLDDGISAIAVALARAVRRSGGAIRYGAEATAIETVRGRAVAVRLADGTRLEAAAVVAALPLLGVRRLLGAAGVALDAAVTPQPQRWGAFTAYVGLPPGVVPDDLPLHHQTYAAIDAPLGEGNTAFVSFSDPGNRRRARGGGRAVTLSTHTDVARWERARGAGTEPALRAALTARLRAALERVLPGAWERATLVETGTPFTFERYTGRDRGLVGGVPQTPDQANLGAPGARTPIGALYVCGDTTFPGQSTVGASLSGVAAARAAGARLGGL